MRVAEHGLSKTPHKFGSVLTTIVTVRAAIGQWPNRLKNIAISNKISYIAHFNKSIINGMY